MAPPEKLVRDDVQPAPMAFLIAAVPLPWNGCLPDVLNVPATLRASTLMSATLTIVREDGPTTDVRLRRPRSSVWGMQGQTEGW